MERDEARVIFNPTEDGYYRHEKPEYRKVGALFLTWRDDGLQCKETNVGIHDELHEKFLLTHGC